MDVIIGGFPCQDISINGKMLGIKGKRSSLYSYIVKAVSKCRPKVFLAENVGSLMLKQHETSFKKILTDHREKFLVGEAVSGDSALNELRK